MEKTPGPSKSFQFRDPRHQRIYRRLLLVGPGVANFFRDACQLMRGEADFLSQSHLVGHLVREIESALRDVLRTVSGPNDPEKKGKSNEAHKEDIRLILKSLDLPESDEAASAWLNAATGLAKRAHRDCLEAARPVDSEFRGFWRDFEDILDVVLERFESRFLVVMPILDGLAEKAHPTQQDANLLKSGIPNNFVTMSYFFDKLENASWLRLLRSEGFFGYPPLPHLDEEGNLLATSWPLCKYLGRMAKNEPSLVSTIIGEIPANTNIRVHLDLADALLQLPPELSVLHTSAAIKWLEKPFYFSSLPEKLGQLLSNVVKQGFVKEGVALAAALLAIVPDTPATEENPLGRLLGPGARPQRDMYHYEQTIEKHIPDLVAHAGFEALKLLADLLDRSIRISVNQQTTVGETDYSTTWCRAIEKGYQDRSDRDIRVILMGVVRDAAESIIKSNPLEFDSVLEIIQGFKWHVFQRLTLYLLKQFPSRNSVVFRKWLLERSKFDDSGLQPEYALLMEACFGKLELHEKEIILGWISEGPDLEGYRKGYHKWHNEDPSKEELLSFREYWTRERLHPMRANLPIAWKKIYEDLVAKSGEATPLIRPPMSVLSVRRTSPLDAKSIGALSDDELLNFLATWQPEGDPYTHPSREGLVEALGSVIRSQLDRFVKLAPRFDALGPDYVNKLVSVLRESAKEKWEPDWWPPVIGLCQAIVHRVAQLGSAPAEEERWSWTRQSIASLINLGFEEEKARPPIELRQNVWNILEKLSHDPDPDPHPGDRERDDLSSDPVTQSINTVRGESLHAILRYAMWVEDNRVPNQALITPPACGLDAMQEVLAVLDRHLDVSIDSSLAIRSVYGQWLPWIHRLDSEWVRTRKHLIFSADKDHSTLWLAAWEGYINWSRPYVGVFQTIRAEYDRALGQLGRDPKSRAGGNSDEHLSEHLMIFYLRGHLQIEETNGFIQRFFDGASSELRSHAVRFVGLWLRNQEQGISSEVDTRLKDLWKYRLSKCQETDRGAARVELIEFGGWFASGRLDANWSVNQLEKVLSLVGWAEPDHEVVEQLSTIANAFPLETVTCLSVMIDGDKNGWGISLWAKHAREILLAARDSAIVDAQKTSISIINRLAARGIMEFSDLLTVSADATQKVS